MRIFRLAIKDLAHDWLLTACTMLVIASIAAPIITLFGIKSGTITTLRQRLIENPVNREIRPLQSSSFTNEWLQALRTKPEVSFVIPMTRQISSTVTMSTMSTSRSVGLLATADNDDLLLHDHVTIPKNDECVLTSQAAEHLQVHTGELVEITTTRRFKGKHDMEKIKVKVVGILSAGATNLQAAYVPLQLLDDIERFKDGLAVENRGWVGSKSEAYPIYDGVRIRVAKKLSVVEETKLITHSGFSTIDVTEEPENFVYTIRVLHTPAHAESLGIVERKLRGKRPVLTPVVDSVVGEIDNQQKPLRVLPGDYRENTCEIGYNLYSSSFKGSQGLLKVPSKNGHLEIPVCQVEYTAGEKDALYVNQEIAGIFRFAQTRPVIYNDATKTVQFLRRGHASFRMYARSIDDVEGLAKFFIESGIEVKTEKQRIYEVRQLDKYLSILFWMIAGIGIFGGVTALTMSLYAAAERKQREMSIMRLLGFPSSSIIKFPIYQSCVIGAVGVVLALAVYALMETFINLLFQKHFYSLEKICDLQFLHVSVLSGVVLLTSCIAAAVAVKKSMSVDPADALRDE